MSEPHPHESADHPDEHPLEEGFPELEAQEPVRRHYPSTLGGVLYLGILGATVAGLAIVTFGEWRFGIKWVGGALLGAAVCRLVLPRREAGMLEVRNRFVDALLLGGVGVAIIALSVSIPNQPV